MTANTSTAASFALPQTAPASARAVFKIMAGLQVGSLDVQLPDGSQAHFAAPGADSGTGSGTGVGASPRAALRLHDWSLCRAVLKSGDIGFAESYIAGGWSSPDLAALLRLLIANRPALESVIYGTWWGSLAYRIKHLLNRNSRKGSRKNIHAHYDIGNPFYRLWLDETMNYSSALFEGDFAKPTADAQLAKVRRAVRECRVQPGERLLEIGCGWGALAQTAAAEFDAHVTGVTLSSEQLVFARERMARAELAHLTDLRLQDYRDIGKVGSTNRGNVPGKDRAADAPFDAIVSIEMFEAVGRAYWDSFFTTLARQLKPGGHACIQTITIRDDLFDRYLKSTDFIQQYIFPGGLLPSPSAFRAEAAKAGLEVVNECAFGADYAETLRRWRADFLARDRQVRKLGFDNRFIRIWEFYLAYSEAAFDTGNTNVMQFTLRRGA